MATESISKPFEDNRSNSKIKNNFQTAINNVISCSIKIESLHFQEMGVVLQYQDKQEASISNAYYISPQGKQNVTDGHMDGHRENSIPSPNR